MSEPNSYYDAKGIVEMDLILKKEFPTLFDNGTQELIPYPTKSDPQGAIFYDKMEE